MTTAQINAISNPAVGLTVFNTDSMCYYTRAASKWFSYGCCTPFATPVTNLTADRGFNSALITFTPGGSETSFTVTKNPGAVDTVVSGSPVTIGGLQDGVTYSFDVKSKTVCSYSSVVTSNSVAACTPAPTNPTGVSASVFGQTATITFTPQNGDTIFYIASNPAGYYDTVKTSPSTISNLPGSTNYTFTVKSKTRCSVSSGVTTNQITTCAPEPLNPTSVSATVLARKVTLNFTPQGSATTFYISSSPAGINDTITSSPWVYNGLTAGTNYTFTVKSVTSCGLSPGVTTNSVEPWFEFDYGGDTIYVSNNNGNYNLNNTYRMHTSNWGPNTNTDLNRGDTNTIYLVNYGGYASQAAYICSNLSAHGYTDWYLPAAFELDTMLNFHSSIPGASSSVFYWSSSRYNNVWNAAWRFSQTNGWGWSYHSTPFYIRCIRRK